jgi:DNA-binding NtrC family response regulator
MPDRHATVPHFPAVGMPSPAPRIQVVVEREAGVPRSVGSEHDGSYLRIGSHPSNEVVLADPTVSRFHLALERGASGWHVRDQGSLNGTRIGGVVVRDADVPSGGCALEIGDSTVRIREIRSTRFDELSASTTLGGLHGKSQAMRRLFALIERVAASDSTVLIEGESGSGKELVATEIVRAGARADKPLVIVDCGAISPSLFESILFGHCRGAFTGADRDRVGSFEAASGGTLFLDEIGEMPLEMQPKLLRALQSREVCRVGETKPRPVNVRILAATNRRLEREVNHGTFREDLFFRLAVITVRVPPLRERLDDIELLVPAILESLGVPQSSALFDAKAMAQMAAHDWPGNVRELRNFVERAVVLDTTVDAIAHDAQPAEEPGQSGQVVASIDLDVPLRTAKENLVASFEKKYLAALLDWSRGNVSRAARRAAMDRINLHRLIQRYGLRSSRSIKD